MSRKTEEEYMSLRIISASMTEIVRFFNYHLIQSYINIQGTDINASSFSLRSMCYNIFR